MQTAQPSRRHLSFGDAYKQRTRGEAIKVPAYFYPIARATGGAERDGAEIWPSV